MTNLTDKQIYSIGFFDKSGRYYLKSEFETDTSRKIREPSRSYPYSIFSHVHTKKFYESLSEEQKRLMSMK